MQDAVVETLAKRRDAVIKSILRYKEMEIDGHIPTQTSRQFRKLVLDEINEFHGMVIRILSTYENTGVLVNDLYLQKLDELYEDMRERREKDQNQ
jgi:hypothetical protein